MSFNVAWVRTLRTIVVAGLLVIALLGAVLGLVGATEPTLMWACHPGMHGAVSISNHC